MKLLLSSLTVGGALLLATHADAAGAAFDASSSKIKLREGAALAVDFESPDRLVGYELTTWKPGGAMPLRLERKPIADAKTVEAMLSDDEPIEGSRSLRLSDGQGLVIKDSAAFGSLADGRLEVTLWARAEGSAPTIQITYGKSDEWAFSGYEAFAQVAAVRSGRETTDGWVEYTSGPLEGSIWKRPIRGVVIAPSVFGPPGGAFSIDAVEVRRLPGAPLEAKACTQANVSSVCGDEGDCMYGHCVPASITWGALPPPEHRADIAERLIFSMTRINADRNSVSIVKDTLVPKARQLAKSAKSSREFFGGLYRLVGLSRNQHTTMGDRLNYTEFAPTKPMPGSTELGACFGVVDKDLLGGGLGFAVYKVEDAAPATGVQLKPGDVLTTIDGRDPKAWLDEFGPDFVWRLPNDPESEPTHYAWLLTQTIMKRASTITLTRCASSTDCSEASRQTLTIDVGKTAWATRNEPNPVQGKPFICSPRFTNAISNPDRSGVVSSEDGPNGETRVQFDHFMDSPAWRAGVATFVTKNPDKLLMDARMGKGGSYPPVELMVKLLRGTSEPFGVVGIGRGTYDLIDPPWLFQRTAQCKKNSDFWNCYFTAYAYEFFTDQDKPILGDTKIAWLNAIDASSNDFAPRLLKGRSNLKIFAPHATVGAFGSSSSMPAIAADWDSGSIQLQDSKFGSDPATAYKARWESGHGVEPDVKVAQKLSDTLAGVDTMLKVASAWLAE